jgi:hypothetical protein
VAALHDILGLAVVVGALVVLGATTWSAVAGRRSGGRKDHRLAADRAVLAVLGLVVVVEFLGLALLLTGSRPADPLHFLYGAAALIGLPAAIWIGTRTRPADGSRVRRDAWTAGGAIVLLGIALRLLATG